MARALSQQAGKALPFVEAILVNTDWAIEALSSRPPVSGEQPSLGFAETLKSEYNYLTNALPGIPNYDLSELYTASSATVSGTASVLKYVRNFSRYDTPETNKYTRNFFRKCETIQESQLRPQKTRTLVEMLKKSNILARFDRAQAAHVQAKRGITPQTQTANEIRNLLQGIRGELLELARRTPKEKIDWDEIAKRLAKPGPNDEPFHLLSAQKAEYDSLWSDLSDITKDRTQVTEEKLNIIWIRVLDFIYTVLGLVHFN